MKVKSFEEKDQEAIAARKMFVSTNFVGTLWGASLTLVFLIQEQRIPQVLSVLFVVSQILSLIMRSWTKSTRAGVLCQSFAFYFYLVGLMSVTGGIRSPALIWLPLIIYYIYPLLGKKWTFFWVGLWTLTNFIFWQFDSSGRLPENILSIEAERNYTFLSVIFMLPLGFWLSSIYRRTFEHLRETSHKQRLECSHLLHVISHDIRSPLQIIQSYTHLLKDSTDEKKLTFLAPIEKSVQRIAALLGQVRNYENLLYSKEELALEPVDLQSVVEEALESQQLHFSDKGIQVTVSAAPDFDGLRARVLAHRGALSEHILCNIMSNAFKFTESRGSIKIFVKKENNSVILTIRDNGIGIPNDLMQNIFEFSKKTSRPGTAGEKGSGFGLPIAKLFLDQMNISIEVQSWTESSPLNSQGTEFKLIFDIA